MAILGAKGDLKMIVSHRAPSNLNMSSYGAIWTHFRPNSIIFFQKMSWALDQDQDLVQVHVQVQVLVQVQSKSWSRSSPGPGPGPLQFRSVASLAALTTI